MYSTLDFLEESDMEGQKFDSDQIFTLSKLKSMLSFGSCALLDLMQTPC